MNARTLWAAKFWRPSRPHLHPTWELLLNVLNDWEGASASWALQIIRASLTVVRFRQCSAIRRLLYACMVPAWPRLYLNMSPRAASSLVICFPYMKLELRVGFLRKNVKFKIWIHFLFLFAKSSKRTFIVFCSLLLSFYMAWLWLSILSRKFPESRSHLYFGSFSQDWSILNGYLNNEQTVVSTCPSPALAPSTTGCPQTMWGIP